MEQLAHQRLDSEEAEQRERVRAKERDEREAELELKEIEESVGKGQKKGESSGNSCR
jgi:hypothetical protein